MIDPPCFPDYTVPSPHTWPHAMLGASAMAKTGGQTCRPLVGGAAGVSSRSNAWLLMIRGDSNQLQVCL